MENTYKAIKIVKTRNDESLSQDKDNGNATERVNLNVIQKEEWKENRRQRSHADVIEKVIQQFIKRV